MKITLHIGFKKDGQERKAKEMGEFPGIHIVPSNVYVLWTLIFKLQVLACTKCYLVLPICLLNFGIFPKGELTERACF